MLSSPPVRPRRPMAVVLMLAAIACPVAVGAASSRYDVDQQSGRIAFQTRGFGLLTVHGHFGRFHGQLHLDPDDLGRTRIDMDVDAGTIESPWPGMASRLRSLAYFDADAFPRIRFRSTAVTPGPDRRFVLSGLLTIRGVERPQRFDVTTTLPDGGDPDGPVADIVATGTLQRSEFGMADDAFVSDVVRLTITTRIRLPRGTAIPSPAAARPN